MKQPIKNLEELLQQEPSKNKSGFFDLNSAKKCNHPSHELPTHLHIPQGKGYRHVCPNCGKVTVIIPPQVSL